MKKQFLNQLLNVFWTIVGFAPLVVYWARAYGDFPGMMYGFLALSLGGGCMPRAFYEYFQLSPHRKFYEKIGIRTIGKFTQNGTMVNRRAELAGHKPRNRRSFTNYSRTIAQYERFHVVVFCFTLLTSLRALYDGEYVLASLISLANAVYNVFPMLLQQYNKVRLRNAGMYPGRKA